MSRFLSNCIRGAIISALGIALLALFFTIITVAILGAVTGPGDVIAVAAILPLALAAAGLYGAVVLISLILACVYEDGRRQDDVGAGAPSTGGQALEEEKEPQRCIYCEKMRKRLALAGVAVGIVVGIAVSQS